jgi:hypothetical protein
MTDIEYIIFYKACDGPEISHKIKLTEKNEDIWDEKRLTAVYGVKPIQISKITVGPKTVFEYYDGQWFRTKIINDSDVERTVEFGCPKDVVRQSFVRHFTIWTLARYNEIHKPRYCDNNGQCRSNEYCMCPEGQLNPLWCSGTKRRCAPMGYMLHDAPIPLGDEDRLNMNCINNYLSMKKNNSDNLDYSVLEEIARQCAHDKQKLYGKYNEYDINRVEGFNVDGAEIVYAVPLILLMLLIIYLLLS